jgi:hypothetical protein
MLTQKEFTKQVKITKRYGAGSNGRRFANLELHTDTEVWLDSVVIRSDHGDSELGAADIKAAAWETYQEDHGVMWPDAVVRRRVVARLDGFVNEEEREIVYGVMLEMRDTYQRHFDGQAADILRLRKENDMFRAAIAEYMAEEQLA